MSDDVTRTGLIGVCSLCGEFRVHGAACVECGDAGETWTL